MIISVAVWRIYPSWVNDKLRAWEGLGHSRMFWARLSRDDFRSKLEIISFLSRVMSVSKSFFCFPRFCKIWRQIFNLWGFWFRRCLGGLFENSAPSPGIFLRTPTTWTTTTSIFLKISFLFSKTEPMLLTWPLMAIPKLSKALWWWNIKDQNENLTSVRWRDGAQKDHGSSSRLARVVCGDPWSKREKNKEVSVWLCEVSILHHLQTSEFWGACFRDPMSLPFRTSLFSRTQMYSCRTVRLQRGESEEKQSSVTFPVLITEA